MSIGHTATPHGMENEMIRYHYFTTQAQADAFLADLRSNGGMGYSLGLTCDEIEVREVLA